MHYLKKTCNLFIESFKNRDFRILFPVLYDLLFVAVTFLIFNYWFSSFKSKLNEISNIDFETALATVESIQVHKPIFEGVLYFIWGSILFVILAMFLNYAVTRYLSWSSISKKKLSWKNCGKFLLLSLVWVLLALVPVIIALIPPIMFIIRFKDVVERPSASIQLVAPFLVIFLIFLYLANVSYSVFSRHHTVKSIFKSAKLSIFKIHYLFQPYLLLLIGIMIVGQLSKIFAFNEGLKSAVHLILFLVVLSWHRFYLNDIVSSFEK